MPRKVGLLTPERRKFVKNGFKYLDENLRDKQPKMAYEIRQKAKNAIKDLILIAKHAPEKEKQRIFSPDLIVELIQTIVSKIVDFSDFNSVIRNTWKLDLAYALLWICQHYVIEFETPIRRNKPVLIKFKNALVWTKIECDLIKLYQDSKYRAELFEKLQNIMKKGKLPEEWRKIGIFKIIKIEELT